MSENSDTLYKYDALYDNFYPVTLDEAIRKEERDRIWTTC